jgi:hypothetical protein
MGEQMDQEQEADILFPEPEKVVVGGRTYEIKPIVLANVKTLIRLKKLNLNLSEADESLIDRLVDGISELLHEPDKEFILQNVSIPLFKEIFTKVKRSTYMGIPDQGGTPKGKTEEPGRAAS